MSREKNFTPGPWFIDYGYATFQGISSHNDNLVCDVESDLIPGENVIEPTAEQKANAHLIAAAPELLEALEMVRDADDDCRADGFKTIPSAARRKIDNALAKAYGETE